MPRNQVRTVEIIQKLRAAEVLIERWRVHDNTRRLQNPPGDRSPAPEAVLTTPQHNQITT